MGFLDHKRYTVYRVTNVLNGKVYVGVTTKSLNERWKHHVFSSKNNDLVFGAAIRKYGEDRFTMEVLEKCESRQHMLEREKFWIEELNSHVSQGRGYNMTMGGEGVFGYNHTEEAKRSMSEKRKGAQNHNFGKRWGREAHPPEFLEMMSKRHSGAGNPMFGRKHSEEARQKISKHRHKKVAQLDLNGNKIMEYDSMKEAAKNVGCYPQGISRACRFPRRTAAGYKWRYADGGN